MGHSKIYFKFLNLFFIFLAGSFLNAQVKEPVRIGVYDNSPKIFLDEEGKAEGIFIEIINEIAKTEDLEIQYVYGEWNDLKIMLQQGRIDVLPDFASSNERDSLFTINTIPVLSSWVEAYSLTGAGIHSVKQLNNKTIGLLEGSVQEEYFRDELPQKFTLSYKLITYNDYSESVEALEKAEIDILIADRFLYFSEHFSDEISPTGIIFRPSDLFFAFQKNADPDLVNLFDRNLADLKNDPHSSYYQILHSWFDPVMRAERQNYFLWALVGLLVILLVVLIFAFLLKYQVKVITKALWRRNRQLTRAKEKAEENERLKSIFLQNMSHEIRTPMNGIIGFLSLLKEPDLDSQSREKYIDIVNKSGKRLLTTINNIIEISKIDSRQIEIRTSEVDLIEITNFYYNFFLPQAREKNLEFKLNCTVPREKGNIITDKFILDNILTNLINNALKFTNKGIVELGNSLENGQVKFYVKDSGVGIPKERQNAIFERFVQANLNMTRAHEGSGLGLAIVKAYVEILAGEIWVESEEGKGSTFFFTFPYIPAKNTSTEDYEAPPMQLEGEHLKILIAEDDNISFLFIQQILNRPEISLLRAINGEQVVELARENPDLSLILMDIKMPVKSGIEATKEIRKFNPDVPIIAQSAYSFAEDQEKAIRAGCNDYITKPINKNNLFKIIRSYSRGLRPGNEQ